MKRLYVITKEPNCLEFWDGTRFTPCLQYAMMFTNWDEANYERQAFCPAGAVMNMDANFYYQPCFIISHEPPAH